MSEVARNASEDSEDSEDIFKTAFSASASTGGKVKITGGGELGGEEVGLANAKLKDCQLEKSDRMKPVCDSPEKEAQSSEHGHSHQVVATKENGGAAEHGRNNTAASQPTIPGAYQPDQPYQRQQHRSHEHYDSVGATTTTTSESLTEEELEDEDKFIEVKVSDPAKVGDGITSYLAYRVCTRTNLGCFKRQEFWVTRRFSDFLGLHEKLQERYASQGRLIPPPPEKNLVGTTKVKISSSSSPTSSSGTTGDGASPEQSNGHAFQQGQPPPEGVAGGTSSSPSSSSSSTDRSEFIARRRFALERFINRVSAHPVLRLDPATVRFLESVGELPRATSTSALSSASVLRLFGRAADTVTKMTTYRMEETDPWYREKVPQIEQLDSQLRKLCGLAESLVQCRQELAMATGSFAQGTAILSSTEEAHSLSRALAQLARVEEKVQQVHHRQAEADYYYLLELIKDYVSLVGAVKAALGERTKAFQQWEHARHTLLRKREQQSRLEMGGRAEKVPAASDEVREWERRVDDARRNFHLVSEVVKREIGLFERYRVRDFKTAVVQYLEALMACQMQMVKHWEEFLPQVKAVLF